MHDSGGRTIHGPIGDEIEGSFLWLPKTRTRSAARAESYRNMQRVLPGDVIFSFAEGAVGAVGVALAPARQAPRPPELAGIACGGGSDTGWLLPVRFAMLKNSIAATRARSPSAADPPCCSEREDGMTLKPREVRRPTARIPRPKGVLLTAVPAPRPASCNSAEWRSAAIVESVTDRSAAWRTMRPKRPSSSAPISDRWPKVAAAGTRRAGPFPEESRGDRASVSDHGPFGSAAFEGATYQALASMQ